MNRINFEKVVEKHGGIKTVSNSGLNFVLKKNNEEIRDQFVDMEKA